MARKGEANGFMGMAGLRGDGCGSDYCFFACAWRLGVEVSWAVSSFSVLLPITAMSKAANALAQSSGTLGQSQLLRVALRALLRTFSKPSQSPAWQDFFSCALLPDPFSFAVILRAPDMRPRC